MQHTAEKRTDIGALALVAFIAALAGISLVAGGPLPSGHTRVVALLLAGGIIATIGIFMDPRVISVSKAHWIFMLIFMSWAPLSNHLQGYFSSAYFVSDASMERAAMLALLWEGFFMTAQMLCRQCLGPVKSAGLWRMPISKQTIYIGTACAAGCALAYLWLIGGFSMLFARASNQVMLENTTMTFVIQKTLTAVPAMVAALAICARRQGKVRITMPVIVLLVGLSLLLNFPASTTRYWMAAILGGLFLHGSIRKKTARWFDWLLLLGLLFVYPGLYVFKTMRLGDLLALRALPSPWKGFQSMDFDAFFMLARSIDYVDGHGLAWGKQLVNILFFFIPRAIWPSKPVPTNVLVTSAQGASFTNLSCPIIAEGYVNFGVVGVALFAIVFGLCMAWLDERVWCAKRKRGQVYLPGVAYPFMALITIYVCRGPLQPAVIQTVALLLPVGLFAAQRYLRRAIFGRREAAREKRTNVDS